MDRFVGSPPAALAGLTALMAVLAWPTCTSQAFGQEAAPAAAPATEELLGPFPADLLGVVAAVDAPRVAYVVGRETGVAVLLDGRELGVYEAVAQDSLLLSPDGAHALCTVRQGGQWRVALDGQVLGEYPGALQAQLSDDGAHFAFVTVQGEDFVVVRDGSVLPGTFSAIMAGSLTLSRDGARLAFAALRGTKETGKRVVVTDGEVGAEWDDVYRGSPHIGPGGAHVAYAARRGESHYVVVDGREGPAYDGILEGSPVFSSDGEHVAYAAHKGDAMVAVIDGQEGPEFDRVPFAPVLNRDASRAAYPAVQGDQVCVVVDGAAGDPWEDVGRDCIRFSPDGSRLAFLACRQGRWSVVVDGQAGPAYDDVLGARIAFSADGTRVGYVGIARAEPAAEGAGDGTPKTEHVVVVDGKPGPAYEAVATGHPVFSPDGKHSAYVARKGGQRVVVIDGHEAGPYERYGLNTLTFSPDSRHLALAVGIGDKQAVVLDGRAGALFDQILEGGPRFRAGGALEYLAVRGEQLYRVRHVPDR